MEVIVGLKKLLASIAEFLARFLLVSKTEEEILEDERRRRAR